MPTLTRKPPTAAAPAADATPTLRSDPCYRDALAENARLVAIHDKLLAELRQVDADIAAANAPKFDREGRPTGAKPARPSRLTFLRTRRATVQGEADAAADDVREHKDGPLLFARAAALNAVKPGAFASVWRPAVREAAAVRLAYFRDMHAAKLDVDRAAAGLAAGELHFENPLPWVVFGRHRETDDYRKAFEAFARELVAGGFFDAHEPAVVW